MGDRRRRKLGSGALQKMWEQRSGSFGSFVSSLTREGIPYLSYTRVSTVERCRLCYYRQYILGIKPTGSALVTGTLVHEAAQVAYEHMRAGRSVDFVSLGLRTARRHPEPSCRPLVKNGVATLSTHLWEDHKIVGIEEPFFLDLSVDLPPIIGVVDLILRDGTDFLVVDHKTGSRIEKQDAGQLVLYAEHVRRKYGAKRCDGAFDQYRMVPNLEKVRTPVHKRTLVKIRPTRSAALVPRYRRAWTSIQSIRSANNAWRGENCWFGH